jgi:hypothetical protein
MGNQPRRPVWWYLPDHNRRLSRRPWIPSLGGEQRGRTRYPLGFNSLRGHSWYCWWYPCYLVSPHKGTHSYTVTNVSLGHTPRKTHRDTQLATPSTCAAKSAFFYCKWENRQRDLGKRDHRLVGATAAQIKDLGYRHPEFRYIH